MHGLRHMPYFNGRGRLKTGRRSFQAALRFSVRVQQRGGKGRPDHAAQAAFGEAAVEPAVAGVEQVVAAFGFVESVVGGVVCVGQGQGFAAAPFEVAGEVFGKTAVLFAGDGEAHGVFAFGGRRGEVVGVDQGFVCAAEGAGGGGGGEVAPARGVEVEAALAPAEGDVAVGRAVFAVGGLFGRGGGAPVVNAVVQRHNDVGMHAVAAQIEGDAAAAFVFALDDG